MADNGSILNFSEDAYSETVDTEHLGREAQLILDFLNSRVIGQPRAAIKLSRGFAIRHAGMQDEDKPIIVALFAGPTGVGKTLMAEELARYLIEDNPIAPLTRIECQTYIEPHQVAEIIGSPPGYVGFDGTPKLAQLKIDEFDFFHKWREHVRKEARGKEPPDMDKLLPVFYERNKPFTSVVLFDEVEKAARAIHNALLGIVDSARLAMANGDVTYFNGSAIIMTCNIGSNEVMRLVSGKTGAIGFSGAFDKNAEERAEEIDDAVYRLTSQKIKEFFPAEFVGRILDNIIVFRTLNRDQGRQVLELMLNKVRAKVSGTKPGSVPIKLEFSEAFKEYLLDKGTSSDFGLRRLRQVVLKEVTLRLANGICAGDVKAGDEVMFRIIGRDQPKLCRKPRPVSLIVPPPKEEPEPDPGGKVS